MEAELRNKNILEISSQDLGELVLERLRGIDVVAYIRFASVYRDFQTVEEFKDALKGFEEQE